MCLSPVHSSGTCTTYGDLLHFPHLGPEHIFSGSIGHPCGSTGADRWFVPDWMIDGSRPRLFYPVKSIGREQKQSAYTLLKLGLDKKNDRQLAPTLHNPWCQDCFVGPWEEDKREGSPVFWSSIHNSLLYLWLSCPFCKIFTLGIR